MRPFHFVLVCFLTVGAISISRQVCYAQLTPDVLIGQAVAEVSPAMSEPINEAIALFQARQFDDARKVLSDLCRAHPQLQPAGVLMAQMFFAANQVLAARSELERCVLEHPTDPEPYIMFGDLAFQNGQLTETGLCFDKAHQLVQAYRSNPRRQRALQIRAYAGQAAVASARKQYTVEEQLLTKWIALEPNSIPAYTRLARCQYNQGGIDNEKKAYATFSKLYDEIDNQSDAAKQVLRPEVNMAVLYTQNNRLDHAQRLMGFAMQRAAAEDITTRLAVSQWAMDTGNLKLAKEAAAAAYRIKKDSVQVMLLLGVAARFDGDAERAAAWFRAAHAKAPTDFLAINHLALTLIEIPDAAKQREAQQFAELNQRQNNNFSTLLGREAAATLAWTTFRLGREEEAERSMLQIVQSGLTISNEAAYHAAIVLSARGHKAQARQMLQSLMKQPSFFPGREKAKALLEKLNSEAETTTS